MSKNLENIELYYIMQNAYISYAMATIIDRALPDVRDGVLPVHRRILYSMYKKGLTYNKDRAKSSEPVAETMKIHNHGDMSIYQSIALLTEQNESLLHPFIDGEGSFGKVYSTDSPSHMRYTFCRLNKFSEEMFQDFDKEIIKMIGEDKNHLEPAVLNCSYPNILVKPNEGIAVGESCKFGSFPISEVCDATISYINNKNIDLLDYLLPDFSTGGYLLYNKESLRKIYDTGIGSIILRSKYKYDKELNMIEIYEIPYSTTVNKIVEIIKSKMDSYKEILDVRNETGFNKETNKEELKITIDVKKNTDITRLMNKLFKSTPLQSSFSYNMNCLVNYKPKVLGIKQMLDRWIEYRMECINKAIDYDINNKSKELHILLGLKKVLLDIDNVIKIIRKCNENEIINELCKSFELDTIQADFISNLKLKNINKDYIVKQIKDINSMQEEIDNLRLKLNNNNEINKMIINDLKRVKKVYSKPRATEVLYEDTIQDISKEDLIEDYNCKILYTKGQYIKKLNRSIPFEQHKLKDNDVISEEIFSTNKSTLLFFTNKNNRYKLPCYQLEVCSTPSRSLGEYFPNILELEEGEEIIKVVSIEDESKGYIISAYENGKVSKVNIKSFTGNYTKLKNSYSEESKLIAIGYSEKDIDLLLISEEGKALVINSSRINAKNSRNAQGNIAMNLGETEDNKVISSVINPTQSCYFTLRTEKGKNKEFRLDDIAPTNKLNEERSLYSYIQGKPNNQGNFLINTRTNEDRIIEVIINDN